MARRVNLLRTAVLVGSAALLIYMLIVVGRSPIAWLLPSANAQTAPPRVTLPTVLEGMDRMTYVMPLDQGHPLCWSDGNTPTRERTIRFYRYRVEGGPKQLYLDLPWMLWVAQPVATNYCAAGTHKVPKAGHWIYEAEICWWPVAPDRSNCSAPVVSAGCAAGSAATCSGAVGDAPRGWWVYAYLPAPTGVVIN
jgi:hypothetical protein